MKMSRFVKKVVAKIKGDSAEVLAISNEEIAIASLESIIAELNYKLVEAKSDIKIAEKDLDDVMYPASKITNKDAFKNALKTAKNKLVNAEDNLSQIEYDINFYKSILTDYNLND